jgi:hypothetical protein
MFDGNFNAKKRFAYSTDSKTYAGGSVATDSICLAARQLDSSWIDVPSYRFVTSPREMIH